MPKIIDREERRDRLAAAVLRVIRRGGIDAATIRNIAAESGWSRGVVEHYFDGRDELMAFSYRYALSRAFPDASSVSSIEDPRDRLLATVMAWLPHDDDSRLDNKLWLDFVGRLHDNETLRGAVAEVNDQWIADIAEDLAACAADGRYRLVHSLATVAEMLSVFVDGVLISDQVYPERIDRTARESFVTAFVTTLVVPAA
ncbi:TetR/AcrR family transcriptional regulator [Amnibacterium flavum]|uniref:TetR/AcrR family transcriptional regulator n=1 Tax=Amnibacterium flavum TaxID=2173173 RepID=UPI00140220E9|nr:TetR/AcrR family transcriptional regulator [Amnibacterium flavum]